MADLKHFWKMFRNGYSASNPGPLLLNICKGYIRNEGLWPRVPWEPRTLKDFKTMAYADI